MKDVGMTIGAMVVILSVANIASADTFGTGDNKFTIDFVNISGDTNPASSYGIVNNDYRIGTYEITNDQWNRFKAAYGAVTGSEVDPFTSGGTAYDQSANFPGTDVPTNNLSWPEGAQFVNYLNTSTDHQAAYKFTGTQGTGDYTFTPWDVTDNGYNASNPYRNSNAYYFLPTEDEWVKAAYWNGTGLQTYANALPGDLVSGSPDPAKWNYGSSAGYGPWDVGSGSEELNGTFDMMGNVWEWMESPWSSGDYLSSSDRGVRGGSFANLDDAPRSSFRGLTSPGLESIGIGFRVASVPEPCSLVLLSLGGLVLRRRRAL